MAINIHSPKPLYQQIMDDIEAQIASAYYGIDEKIPSHNELAKIYKVSLSPIKRAVTDLIKNGTLYSRIGKGVFVAKHRTGTRVSNHETIGMVLRDLKSPFFSLIMHGIEAKASEAGYNLLLSNTAAQQERERSQIAHFRKVGVDGLIIASTSHSHYPSESILQLKEEGFPFVMISYLQDEGINYVGTDHELGAFLATEHLAKLGYKRIGHISGEVGNFVGDIRARGYQRALQTYGHSYINEYLHQLPLAGEWNHYQGGYQIGKTFTELDDRADAIFAYNDLAALGFEQAVLTQGLKIPDDVAIVGFDDIEQDLQAPVPMTTIHQSTTRIGVHAVETLTRIIKGEREVVRTLLKPRLVIRDSCGAGRDVASMQ